MSPNEFRWYLVQTHPRAERKAVVHLERQGFVTYLPRYKKRRKHARSVEMVPAPLFPGYLFVQINLAAQRWRSISSTIGVKSVVCNGERPTAVPEYVVTQLRGQEDVAGFVQLAPAAKFQAGDKVRMHTGAFADCFGLYETMRDSDRVTVLLDLLGRKVRVTVGLESVAAA